MVENIAGLAGAFALYPEDALSGISTVAFVLILLPGLGLVLLLGLIFWIVMWAVIALVFAREEGLGFGDTLLMVIAVLFAMSFYLPIALLEWLSAELAQLNSNTDKTTEVQQEIDKVSGEYLRRVIDLFKQI
jgi:type III secretory pathway component EscS